MPRSFAIQVKTGLSLNQLRLARGDVRLGDARIRELQAEQPLLYLDSDPVAQSELAVSDGLFLSLDVSGPSDRVVGYRAKKNSLPVDLGKIRAYRWSDYWDPVYPEAGGKIVLEPEIFYLLLSAEGVSIPPQIAAEMMAYDPTAGELRTHYAGFFDPGFGYDPAGARPGSRAALEVRARDVPFMVEHRQPVCKLGPRVDGVTGRAPLRRRPRLQLPGPGDDALQALRGADRRDLATSSHFSSLCGDKCERAYAVAGSSSSSRCRRRIRWRRASSSASSAAISSRRARTSSSWRSA